MYVLVLQSCRSYIGRGGVMWPCVYWNKPSFSLNSKLLTTWKSFLDSNTTIRVAHLNCDCCLKENVNTISATKMIDILGGVVGMGE